MLRVAALKGQAWRCFGSPGRTDWLTDVTAFFCTDGPAVTVSGIAEYLDFEGEEDTYSLLHVDDGAADFDEAEEVGRLYFFYAGQRVIDVLIVRETIVENRGGNATWRYVTDIGIVFKLSAGAIAVTKVCHHTELLTVIKADTLEELQIDEPTKIWEDKLGIEYTTRRDFIPIDPRA
ncbi:MAG: hypothetical protein ACKOQ4_04580 [Mycobacterium sp.]